MDKEKWKGTIRSLATFVLLLIVLISIFRMPPSLREISSRKINLNKARNYNCINEIIPTDVDVVFVGNVSADEGESNTTALYYRAQYFLAPRLVHLAQTADLESQMERYDWFLATTIDSEQMVLINNGDQLALVKTCDELTIIQKVSSP